MSDRPLEGQVAWVTGSSRGLGRVIAAVLGGKGARVAVHGTRFDSPRTFDEGESMEQVAADIAAETGVETLPLWGDLTDAAVAEQLAAKVIERFGHLDVLVAAAGGDIGAGGTGTGRAGKPEPNDCVFIPVADIRAVIDRNLLSCIYTCRAVARHMIERRRGRIITIGSVAGTQGCKEGGIYAVAKAGVHHYTRCLADQLRPYNVTVNCIAPGGTITRRFLIAHDTDKRKMVTGGTLERYGQPEEVAEAVAFLASDAGRFISGQVIRVDGASQTWPA